MLRIIFTNVMITGMDFESLARLRKSGLFSDVTVAVPAANNVEFKLHKIILASASKFFEEQLTKVPTMDKILLPLPVVPETNKFANPTQVYSAVFDAMYKPKGIRELVNEGLSADNCFTYYAVADSLQVDNVKKTVADYIENHIVNHSNITSILIDATKLQIPDLAQRCSEGMLQNFNQAISTEEQADKLLRLPYHAFLNLVQQDDIVIDSEDSVFELVVKYIMMREPRKNFPAQVGYFNRDPNAPPGQPLPVRLEPDNKKPESPVADIPVVVGAPNPQLPPAEAPPVLLVPPPAPPAPTDMPPILPPTSDAPVPSQDNPPVEPGNLPLEPPEASRFSEMAIPDLAQLAEQMMRLVPLTDEQKRELLLSLRYKYVSHDMIMRESKNPVLEGFRDVLLEGLSAKLGTYEPGQQVYHINNKPRLRYTNSSPASGNMGQTTHIGQSGVQMNRQGMPARNGSPNMSRSPVGNRNNATVAMGSSLPMIKTPSQPGQGPPFFQSEKPMIGANSAPGGPHMNGRQQQGRDNARGGLRSDNRALGGQDSELNKEPLMYSSMSFGMQNSQQLGPDGVNGLNRGMQYGALNNGSNAFSEANNKYRQDQSGQHGRMTQSRTNLGMTNSSVRQSMAPNGMSMAVSQEMQQQDDEFNFTYRHDFDECGVLYYLGTQGGQADYQNPYSLSLVKVFFSSMGKGSYEDLVGRALVNCRTLNAPNSFMGVDLGLDRFLIPSCYTIRNRDSARHTMLNWLFEGSVDGHAWYILDKRIHKTDDPAFNKIMEKERQMIERRGATSTWSVDQNYLKIASRNLSMAQHDFQGFRCFRIKQISKNSSGADNLALSGVELYGIGRGPGWTFI